MDEVDEVDEDEEEDEVADEEGDFFTYEEGSGGGEMEGEAVG